MTTRIASATRAASTGVEILRYAQDDTAGKDCPVARQAPHMGNAASSRAHSAVMLAAHRPGIGNGEPAC
ncbi:MAG: hypothetical protein ACYC97_06600 [Metallibacterium sp.]